MKSKVAYAFLGKSFLSLSLFMASWAASAQTAYEYPNTTQIVREVFSVVSRVNYLEDPKDISMGPVGYPCIESILFAPEMINAMFKKSPVEQIQSDEALFGSPKAQEAFALFKRQTAPMFKERNAKKADRVGKDAFEKFGMSVGEEPFVHMMQYMQNVQSVINQPEMQTHFEKSLSQPVCAPFVEYLQKNSK